MTAKDQIRKYRDLIEHEDWEEFYYNIVTDTYGNGNHKAEVISEITGLFTDAGYYPIEDLNYIPDFYFYDWDFSHFDIPNKIVDIGFGAFMSCRELTNITIPENVCSIKGDAFMNCSNLQQVLFEDCDIEIAPDAFLHCNSLTNININKTIKEVKESLFISCLSDWLPPSVKSINCIDGKIDI